MISFLGGINPLSADQGGFSCLAPPPLPPPMGDTMQRQCYWTTINHGIYPNLCTLNNYMVHLCICVNMWVVQTDHLVPVVVKFHTQFYKIILCHNCTPIHSMSLNLILVKQNVCKKA